MELFLDQNVMIYNASILLLVALVAIEIIGLFVGMSFGSIAHNDLFSGLDGDGVLSWLHLGKVPFLIIIMIFLASFGCIGYSIALGTQSILGTTFSSVITAPIALFASLPAMRVIGRFYIKYMPGYESEVISEHSLVGQKGIITVGTSTKKNPAEVRVASPNGQTIYVFVQMENDDEQVEQGKEVILTQHLQENQFLGRPGLDSL